MDKLMPSRESGTPEERQLRAETDLCPLEHVLIGSSFVFPDSSGSSRKVINLVILKGDEQLVGDANFLLKPLGLTTKKSNIENIRMRRGNKGKLSGWFSCFGYIRGIDLGYGFDYRLNEPDANGMVPNRFEFKLKREGLNVWDKANEGDLEVFRKIQLNKYILTYGEKIRPFFSLTKDEDTGILTLTFEPLVSLQRDFASRKT